MAVNTQTTNNNSLSAVDCQVMPKPKTSEEILDIEKQPKETCPDINKIIKAINEAYRRADKAEDECHKFGNECEHEDIFSDIRYELSGLDDELEKLRNANDALRTWGQSWKSLAKQLLDYYEPNWRNDRLSA